MSQAEDIVAGLGGRTNIVEIESCITRLRTEVRDMTLVDEAFLRSAGVHGVKRAGPFVQLVLGPDARTVVSDIEGLFRSGQ